MRAGGAVGRARSRPCSSPSFNRTGAYIVVATALFVVPHPRHAVLLRRLPRARPGRDWVSALRGRCARPGPTTARRRRKEKMRREVIRKHTQKEPAERPTACPACARSRPREPEETRRSGRRRARSRRCRRRAPPRPRSRCPSLGRGRGRRTTTRPEEDGARRLSPDARGQAERPGHRRGPRQLHPAADLTILDEPKPTIGRGQRRACSRRAGSSRPSAASSA